MNNYQTGLYLAFRRKNGFHEASLFKSITTSSHITQMKSSVILIFQYFSSKFPNARLYT